VEWLRGGAAPEVFQVTFETSIDGGITWSLLGRGSRITGGWECSGVSLPLVGRLRARGRTSGGYQNASSGIIESVAAFSPTLTEAPTLTTPFAGAVHEKAGEC
jgi:hypothetical protein